MTLRDANKTIDFMVKRYGWDPARIRWAMLNFANYYGSTKEVCYPRNCLVKVTAAGGGLYKVSEIPMRPVAPVTKTGYTRVRRVNQNVPIPNKLEAVVATRTAAKPAAKTAPARRTRKPAPVPEPEPDEVELDDELEDLEDEADEELEDELDEEAEDEEADEEDEDEDEDEESDEDDEADDEEEGVEDEGEEAEADEPAKDYSVYATKSITPAMSDFHDWLNSEVGDLSEMDTERIVALAGTLRMEFQRSDFCKERRAERQAERGKAAAAAAAKAKAAAKAPAAKSSAKASAPAETATRKRVTAADAKTTPGKVAGKPAPRGTDRASVAKPATAKTATGGRATTRRKGEKPY